ncbi:DUF3224 domain-containing protein [Pleionea sediminis]|uniref:DUF3224 domain-containing protein n=1 Tax=Pleionea sediminis TaxID=2569479 RepID=UPI001186E07D|nr:DUF3224 domain-containing protein [Pleionea sediminis]
MIISGKFDVTLNPLDTYATSQNSIKLGRMAIDKTFYGELSAKSTGEMLNTRLPVEGSAGYVAVEFVTGKLNGKDGSFVLQHYGTMSKDGQNLILEVVPDSGIGELQGLSGSMSIQIENGQHFYTFEYELN